MMTIGSLFAGVGGLELGLEAALGASVSWQVEIDRFARVTLAHHWPAADRSVRDVRAVSSAVLAPVDIICGGFPCQDLSVANATGDGLDGGRSGLAIEFLRIVREFRPAWVVAENVHHTWGRWVPELRRRFNAIGYASVPLRVSSGEVGAPHVRRRVMLVANADGQCLRKLSRRWSGSGGEGAGVAREYLWGPAAPGLPRRSDGVSRTMAHRAYGNAVDPRVAYEVGMAMREAMV